MSALPGRAGELLAPHSDRVVLHDLYDTTGATLYDALVRNDSHELRELLALVRTTKGPILELAAGSGRITLPLLTLGRMVTALDLSEPMLSLLDARLVGPLRDRCRLVRGDMTDFALGDTFGAIVLGTTSISLLDAAGRAGLFRAVRKHLADDGTLLMSTVEGDEGGELTFRHPETDIELRLVEHLDLNAGVRTVTVFPAALDADQIDVHTSTIRMIPVAQATEELAAAGLRVRAVYPLARLGRHRGVLLEVVA